MSKIKKTCVNLIIIIAGILIFLVGTHYFLKLKYSKEDPIPPDTQVKIAQYFSGVINCIETCEKNDISIDTEYKKQIEKYSKLLLKNYSDDNMGLITLTQLIYINYYFQLDYEVELLSLLNKHYIRDKKLLSDLKYSSYSNYLEADLDNQQKVSVSLTTSQAKMLNKSGSYVEVHSINEGLANWYNEKITEIAQLDANSDLSTYYIDNLVSIFWYLRSEEELGLIDYEAIYPFLEKYITNDEEIVLNSKYENTLANAIYAVELSQCYITFQNDYSLNNLTKKIFDNINSTEGFEYSKDNILYFNILATCLDDIGSINENVYFTNHINEWLNQNYDICIKETLEETFNKQ